MLALARLQSQGWSLPAWSDKEAGTLRGEAARQLSRSADAACRARPRDLAVHGRLFTRIGLVENEREGELQFYLIGPDQSCAITDNLEIGPDWGDDGDSRRVTTAGLLSVLRSENRIDPEPFALLALGAAAGLAAALS